MFDIFWLACAPLFATSAARYLSNKYVETWSWKRWLYFACWSLISLLAFTAGLRLFIDNETFRYVAGFAPGALLLIMAIVPCGIPAMNTPAMRPLRNLFFVVMGCVHIFQNL